MSVTESLTQRSDPEGGHGLASDPGIGDGSRPSRGRWWLLSILLILYFVSALDRVIIAMVIDPIKADLGIDDVQVGLLVGVGFVLSYALCGIPMGWLADRFSRRWIIYGGVMVWGFATATCGLAANFGQLFASRLMVGAGESALTPSAHSMISDAFPRRNLGFVISIYMLGGVVGGGMSFIVGGLIVSYVQDLPPTSIAGISFAPWQLVFLLAAAPAILLGGLIFLVREPMRAPRQKGAKLLGMGPFLRTRWRLWVSFSLVFGATSVILGALLFWQPTYLTRYFHWSPSDYGLALGLLSTSGGIFGMLFSGWCVDRLYRKGVKDAHLRYYIFAIAFSAPLTVVALTSSNVWIYLTLIWFAYAFLINFLGFGSAAVQITTPPELRGRMSALFTAVIVSVFGAGLGPVVPAIILQHFIGDPARVGDALAYTVGVCAAVAVAAAIYGLKPLREAVQALEDPVQPLFSDQTPQFDSATGSGR